ncbi:hypothetical protein CDAR_422121 [Caerostris darwini]|uniref:Uncharacterized protein n=1 Tax=Caerostris darwini TaxID=1538125 RepID=A0AAV4WTU3_9ARAC|nr:hypothetical protein CDAR_422121 [Caerostris darwini]
MAKLSLQPDNYFTLDLWIRISMPQKVRRWVLVGGQCLPKDIKNNCLIDDAICINNQQHALPQLSSNLFVYGSSRCNKCHKNKSQQMPVVEFSLMDGIAYHQ